MCIRSPVLLLLPVGGGITLIRGSVNVTLRSSDTALAGNTFGGSLLSGSDCVWENCRFGNAVFMMVEVGSSPDRIAQRFKF